MAGDKHCQLWLVFQCGHCGVVGYFLIIIYIFSIVYDPPCLHVLLVSEINGNDRSAPPANNLGQSENFLHSAHQYAESKFLEPLLWAQTWGWHGAVGRVRSVGCAHQQQALPGSSAGQIPDHHGRTALGEGGRLLDVACIPDSHALGAIHVVIRHTMIAYQAAVARSPYEYASLVASALWADIWPKILLSDIWVIIHITAVRKQFWSLAKRQYRKWWKRPWSYERHHSSRHVCVKEVMQAKITVYCKGSDASWLNLVKEVKETSMKV